MKAFIHSFRDSGHIALPGNVSPEYKTERGLLRYCERTWPGRKLHVAVYTNWDRRYSEPDYILRNDTGKWFRVRGATSREV